MYTDIILCDDFSMHAFLRKMFRFYYLYVYMQIFFVCLSSVKLFSNFLHKNATYLFRHRFPENINI